MATPSETSTATPARIGPGSWRIDPASSELGFVTKAMLVFPVRGRFTDYNGDLNIDDSGNANGTVLIEAATIDTGIRRRDKHLRSGDFFGIEEHPHLRFELSSLTPRPDGTAALLGTLHIHGHELPIDTTVSLQEANPNELRLDAEFPVDHHNAGFAFKYLPREVRVRVALALTRTS